MHIISYIIACICHNMNRILIFSVPGSAPLRLHWQQHAGVLQCRCPWAKNCWVLSEWQFRGLNKNGGNKVLWQKNKRSILRVLEVPKISEIILSMRFESNFACDIGDQALRDCYILGIHVVLKETVNVRCLRSNLPNPFWPSQTRPRPSKCSQHPDKSCNVFICPQ